MKRHLIALQLALVAACITLPGAAYAQAEQKRLSAAEYRQELAKNVQATIARYRKIDPGIERFFKESTGYVVFPNIGKAGFIVAGGHGDGEVFEKNKLIGTASVTIATIGLQAGIQDFSQIVFFQNQAAVDRFKQNRFEFATNVSAVILAAGASKGKNYTDGVVVFGHPNAGAMAEIALGTQKFNFKP
jgi:lipid-binding SYLF domain-containing protein